MKLFNIFKKQSVEPVERVIELPRRVLDPIKHGCKCLACGEKFYPRTLLIKGDEVSIVKICKNCRK